MLLPMRELTIFGMLVDPASVLLAVCVVFMAFRPVIDRFVDLNRFVWRRPLFDLALLVIVYAAAILLLQRF
jgi:uncharacterized membrane protein YbhN (UPF0104 family)